MHRTKQEALAKDQAKRRVLHLKRKKALAIEASRLGGLVTAQVKAEMQTGQARATGAFIRARWLALHGELK